MTQVEAIEALRDYCTRTLEGKTGEAEGVLSALVNLVDTVHENAKHRNPHGPSIHGLQADREVAYVNFMLAHDSGEPAECPYCQQYGTGACEGELC